MESASPATLRPSAVFAAIFLAALLAHGGCIHSTFYLDDWWQIVENEQVLGSTWYQVSLREFTYLTHRLTYLCAGMSSPAFHAVNLALHVVTAGVLFLFGGDYLRAAAGLPDDRARRFGCWAGLLFAVHPLCSEIPNYARARDIELVSLFSLLAGRAALRWRWCGYSWWRGGATCLVAVAGATFSKDVGIVVSLSTVALVLLTVVPAREIEEGPPPAHPSLGAMIGRTWRRSARSGLAESRVTARRHRRRRSVRGRAPGCEPRLDRPSLGLAPPDPGADILDVPAAGGATHRSMQRPFHPVDSRPE